MTELEKEGKQLMERLGMFNDAVYAIALTLLVLELKLPENVKFDTPAGMIEGLKEMAPKFLAFLLSVALVGSNWVSSLRIQRAIVYADTRLVVFMIIYLSLVSLTPFTCYLIGTFPGNPISYVVFGVFAILICINGHFFLHHCRKQKLYHRDVDMKAVKQLENSVFYVSAVIAMISGAAFFSTKLSFVLFLAFNLVPFFIGKSLRINYKTEQQNLL